MLFSSLAFLYRFLPAVLAVYALTPRRGKNAVLLVSSLIFYAWGEPRFVVFMAAAVVQGYVFGRLIGRFPPASARGRACLWGSAAVSLGLLGYCKYADFFLSSVNRLTGLALPLPGVRLPIGISFYTFQILSYVIDVYRRTVPPQRSLIDLGAYVALFPQLIAGPIVRYRDVAAQLSARTHTLAGTAYGVRRFLLGLGKKVLIANVLFGLVSAWKDCAAPSVLFCWLYALAFALQLYFDFSGYSDMAIGLGALLGFRFPENFDYPFTAKSAAEFWRRWHISLGTWFRDYVYIPLGGSRAGRGKWLRNVLTVWLLTGLWHGAAWTFVLWGLVFALLLAGERLCYGPALARTPAAGRIYLLLTAVVTFVLFDADSVPAAAGTVAALFGLGGLPLTDPLGRYYAVSFAPLLLIAALGATPLPKKWMRRAAAAAPRAWTVLEPLGLTAILAAATAYLVDGSFNPFLYFRF